MDFFILAISILWLQTLPTAEKLRFALYNSNGSKSSGNSGLLVANLPSSGEVVTFSFNVKNSSRNVSDLACRQMGYNNSVDWFGLTMFNDPGSMSVNSLKTWYKILSHPRDKVPTSYEELVYRLRVGRAINSIVCNGAGNGFHDNCSYSIVSRDRKYMLAIVCKPKPDECAIVQSGIVLMNNCHNESLFRVYKCINSSTYYTSRKLETYNASHTDIKIVVTRVCPKDHYIYQGCETATSGHVKNYDVNISSYCYGTFWKYNVGDGFPYHIDYGRYYLYYRSLGENATFYINSRTLSRTEITKKCNGLCGADQNCKEESNCNGFQYGFYCKGIYISPVRICDGIDHCIDGEDEQDCETKSTEIALTREIFGPKVNNTNYVSFMESDEYDKKYKETVFSNKSICIPRGSGKSFKNIYNNSRCSGLIQYLRFPWEEFGMDYHDFHEEYRIEILKKGISDDFLSPMGGICEFYIDQINCTDPKRGVLPCSINGYPSTVSKFATCVQTPGLCDDGFDNLCVPTTRSCYLHKHKLCDGITDCADQSDEISVTCKRMTVTKCYRRYRHDTKLPIPLTWLTDGQEDCLNGKDEREVWPTCGVGDFTRFTSGNKQCEDVLICRFGSSSFVHFEDLCDGHDQCGHQRLCSKTESPDYVYKTSDERGLSLEFLAHCLPGISQSLGHHASTCFQEDFIPQRLLGLNGYPQIIIPETVKDCRNFFGKAYMYLSCSEKCEDQPICPLEAPDHGACMLHDRFKDRVFTTNLERRDKLTFLIENKYTRKYENNNFQCSNDKCVHREKVCNLVDDCGDGSDEENCSNNFACKSPKRFIAIGQKCDGEIHCEDYSDECNEQCRKEIIATGTLRISSWTIGGAAVLFNSIKLWKNIKVLATRQFTTELNNKVLTSVIHFGDFVTGSYLLTIATVDTFVYSESYCQERVKWISSDGCAFLGVFSTFGMQMSLYSMTCLSIFRAIGVVRVKKIISKNAAMKISLIIFFMAAVSFCQAYIPVVEKYEDFFVNGMTFDPKIKLFPAIVTKDKHIEILREYFGRMSMSAVKTWKKTNKLIDSMFTDQYGGIGRRKIHFYGNDGVCLFKYFVSHDDPQKAYVWTNLLINLLCFFIIFICYSKVLFSSKTQGKLVRKDKDPNKRSKDQEETQKYITVIIMTDFFCWIPFIMVCALHFFQLMDATAWYPISSIVILPINSVINPILYNNYITKATISLARKARIWVGVILNRFSYVRIFQLKSKIAEFVSEYSKDTVSTAGESAPKLDEEMEETMRIENFTKASEFGVSENNFNTTEETDAKSSADDFKSFQRKGLFKNCSLKVHTMEPIAEETTGQMEEFLK